MANKMDNYTKHTLRKCRQYLARKKAMKSRWFALIELCQSEIADSDPHHNYLKAYRKEEIFYWFHIPQWIAQLSHDHMPVKVLDIGGAYGTLALYCGKLLDCDIFMTDFTDVYLSETLRNKEQIKFAVNNIELEPLPWDIRFDVIIFTEVLEHLNFNPKPTLLKIRDSLTDKGKLFLSTPDAKEWGVTTRYYESLHSIPDPGAGTPIIDDHVWQYDKEQLVNLLLECGFRIEKFDYAPGTPNRHFNLQLCKASGGWG